MNSASQGRCARIWLGLFALLLTSPVHGSRTYSFGGDALWVMTAPHTAGVEVRVAFHPKRELLDGRGRCYTVSKGTATVRLAGQPMTLHFAGGKAGPHASIFPALPEGCAAPEWRLVVPARSGPAPVEVTVGGFKAQLNTHDLLAARVLAVPKGLTLTAGAPLALRWMPGTDQWQSDAALVSVQSGAGPARSVTGVHREGMVHFSVPKQAVGAVRISVRPQAPVRLPVVDCGFGRCVAGALQSAPVDVTLVP